jgi:uncharacterized protein (TIRG00374 family)
LAKAVKIALGLAISAGFLYFACRGVDLGESWGHMRRASYPWLLALVAVSIYSNWARAQRWGHFFRHLRRISSYSLFSSTMIGLAANNVMPLRAGEAVRAYSIRKKEGIPFATALTTVILERMFDMMTVLLLLALALFLIPIPESADAQVGAALRLLSAVTAAAIGVVVFLFFKQELMVRWVEGCLGLLPSKIAEPRRNLLHAFVAGLEALTDRRQLLYICAYSLWLWVCVAPDRRAGGDLHHDSGGSGIRGNLPGRLHRRSERLRRTERRGAQLLTADPRHPVHVRQHHRCLLLLQ